MTEQEILLLKRLRKRKLVLTIYGKQAILMRQDQTFRFNFDLVYDDIYRDLSEAISFQMEQSYDTRKKKISEEEMSYIIELQDIEKMLKNKRLSQLKPVGV